MSRRSPSAARTSTRLATGVVALTTLVASAALAAPARSATVTTPPSNAFEMPFPCGQQWTGTTRAHHSPNRHAIDWNRPDDLGDPVVASAPGVVTTAQATSAGGYGKYVVLDHAVGESTVYAHLDGVAVQPGQHVDQGTVVGFLGSTGNSSGPHLHYEQRLDRRAQPAWFGGTPFAYGSTLASRNCVDVPLAANMVRGAAAELVVFRRHQRRSQFRFQRPNGRVRVLRLGSATDEPVLGDWDGDGRANPGVRRPDGGEFLLRSPQGLTSLRFGLPSDRGIAGDWDGDGVWEVGVHRAGTAEFHLRAHDGAVTTFVLGDPDDVPLTGDWNGDGRTDVAVYDTATAVFTLRYQDADGLVWKAEVPFGEPGDLPVAGDWDGNGRTDVGVWHPSTASFSRRVAASPMAPDARTTVVRFGRPR